MAAHTLSRRRWWEKQCQHPIKGQGSPYMKTENQQRQGGGAHATGLRGERRLRARRKKRGLFCSRARHRRFKGSAQCGPEGAPPIEAAPCDLPIRRARARSSSRSTHCPWSAGIGGMSLLLSRMGGICTGCNAWQGHQYTSTAK